MQQIIYEFLDAQKAEDIVILPLKGLSDMADVMMIASGLSSRHVAALGEGVLELLKQQGVKGVSVEGLNQAEWVLIDAGDLILHIFKPEIRAHYNLEKLWGQPASSSTSTQNKPVICA